MFCPCFGTVITEWKVNPIKEFKRHRKGASIVRDSWVAQEVRISGKSDLGPNRLGNRPPHPDLGSLYPPQPNWISPEEIQGAQ